MSVPLEYLPEADHDIGRAYRWYENQSDGLGEQFLAALKETLAGVADNPQLYGAFRRDIRAAPLKRFPCVVYYPDRQGYVLVIADDHGRRSTRTWSGRVD